MVAEVEDRSPPLRDLRGKTSKFSTPPTWDKKGTGKGFFKNIFVIRSIKKMFEKKNCESMPLTTKIQNFSKKLLGDRSTGHKDGETNLSKDKIATSEERTVSQGY